MTLMTNDNTNAPDEVVAAFIENVEKLDDNAVIQLKRNCGNLIKDADAKAISIFYRCLPAGAAGAKDKWFAAACIHCLWKAGTPNRVSLEQALGLEFVASRLSESYLKRVYALMDTEWASDKYMLDKYLSMVKMMKARGYAINGKNVLHDFLSWNSSAKTAQVRWAKELAKYV